MYQVRADRSRRNYFIIGGNKAGRKHMVQHMLEVLFIVIYIGV